MFSIMDLELHPYERGSDDRHQLDWRAPLTPQKYTKATRVNRRSKLRSPRLDCEQDRDKSRSVTPLTASDRDRTGRGQVPISLPDYVFIRRDDDYEPFVTEIWHDQIKRGWPKAIPYTTAQGINVAVRQCVKFISTDDSAYYILLCGGIIGYTSARHDGVNMKTLPRLFHKIRVRAVRALRDDISRLKNGVPSDSLMAVILSFALQETVYDNDLGESPLWPKSPLARAQLLGWVGGLQRHSHHLEAFYELLERRGGLQTVTEPGLRRMIYLCDLLTSSLAVASPRYPLYGSSQTLVGPGKLELDDEALKLRDSFSSKFLTFSPLSWQFLEPIIDLLPDIRDATLAVDMYHRTNSQTPQLGVLTDFANSVQWRILSLCNHDGRKPTEDDSVDETSSSHTLAVEGAMMKIIAKQALEPIRLAILIYSNLVIFPISFSAGVATNLASALRDLYECNQVRIFELELEMWALAMGCLASWGSNDRGWYLKRLKAMTDALCCIDDENEKERNGPNELVFLDLMRGFLWWEHTCLAPMGEIWNEMYGYEVCVI